MMPTKLNQTNPSVNDQYVNTPPVILNRAFE